ncbi:O-antigen ligase family protein [Anaerosporobacter faecicola]|uniref:O-antigen ligase family protein n=1 Tax=Anaerosporobacter faecicola TaxID=2718714 RepID=UPI00143990C7|nr:O-antigen ligase family protein [Anaerosporobacter faecicola]
MSNKLRSGRPASKNKTGKMTKSQDMWSQYVTMVPILFLILMVPLVVHATNVKTYLSQYIWYSKAATTVDLFTKIKSILFLVACGAMVLVLLVYIGQRIFGTRNYSKSENTNADHFIKKIWREQPCLFFLSLYLLWTVLSTGISKHTSTAVRGTVEQYESVWVLLGYGLVVIYLYQFLQNKQQLHMVLLACIGMVAIVSIIGAFQLFGLDFFQSDFGRSLISRTALTFRFDKGHVYSTLYNPNYVGMFVSLFLPLLCMWTYKRKRGIQKGIGVVCILGLILSGFGCRSSSGIVGTLIGMLFFVIFLIRMNMHEKQIVFRSFVKQKKTIVLSAITGMVVFLLVGIVAFHDPIMDKIQAVAKRCSSNGDALEAGLTQIVTGDEDVAIIYRTQPLRITFAVQEQNYIFRFYDYNGTELPQQVSADQNSVMISDERFSDLTFRVIKYDSYLCFAMSYVESETIFDWYFTNQTDGSYYYCTYYGKLIKLDQSQEYKNYWSIGSGRGYIWSRTFPIIKNHILFGTGPDSYVYEFPNEEYLNLYHTRLEKQIITKPHSLYLQIAAQTGIPSLLFFIAFYGFYLVRSIRLYRKYTLKQYEVCVGIAILAGTIGYLVTALANDSCIAVAPLFWTLIGLGLGINRIIQKTA